jgi:hypothetical protein
LNWNCDDDDDDDDDADDNEVDENMIVSLLPPNHIEEFQINH